jgi:pre-mRNA-processing factor 39
LDDHANSHSPSSIAKSKTKENGVSAGELDEAMRNKAENRYPSFYEQYLDPDPAAVGLAIFN